MRRVISTITVAALLAGGAAAIGADQQRDRRRDGTGINYPQNPADCPRYPDCPRVKQGQPKQDQQPGAGPGAGGDQKRDRKRDGTGGGAGPRR